MLSLLPPTATSGIWLTSGNTCYAFVRHIEPDESNTGCMGLHVGSKVPEDLIASSGLLQVHDLDNGMVNCVQALRCEENPCGFKLLVSPLGQPVDEADSGEDDDYLVIDSYDPAPAMETLITDSGCPRGPHLRCEIPANRWGKLPVLHYVPRTCDCGQSLASGHRNGKTNQWDHHWPFTRLCPKQARNEKSVKAKLVRLRQRQILNVDLHVAMQGSKTCPAVAIGHLVSSEKW